MFVIAKRPVRPLLPLVLAAIVLFMNGCASTPDKEDSGGVPSGPTVLAAGEKVGRIQITAEPGLDPRIHSTIEQFKVIPGLDARLRTQLQPDRLAEDGSASLDIRIIKMRVRGTGTAIWWGMMAGADYITVSVDVRSGERSLKTFETGTSTILGGFIFGGREVRINRMLDALAKRIAAGF